MRLSLSMARQKRNPKRCWAGFAKNPTAGRLSKQEILPRAILWESSRALGC
jgi:hypothetical protein